MADSDQEKIDELVKSAKKVVSTPNADRLTFMTTIHHEFAGEPPVTLQENVSRQLHHSEEAYRRRIQVTKEPTPLDYGSWVENPGLVVVCNRIGRADQEVPSEEQHKLRVEQGTLLVYMDEDSDNPLRVPPGFVLPFIPTTHSQVSLQSSGALQVPVALFILPS